MAVQNLRVHWICCGDSPGSSQEDWMLSTNCAFRFPMDMLWQERRGRRDPEHCRHGEVIGCRGSIVTVEVQGRVRLLHRIEHHPTHDDGTNRMKPEGERRHNPEVPAAPTHAPEQI